MGAKKKQKGPQEIDKTPLRVMASTGITHTIIEQRDQPLELRPVRAFQWLGLFVGLIFCAIGGGIFWATRHPATLIVPCIGTVFVIIFTILLLIPRRFQFDRDSKYLIIWRGPLSDRYPLGLIQAVQLIHGGLHGDDERPQFNTYQLNLIINNPQQPRMSISNCSNWEATWQMGHAVSEYLDVPYLDEVSEKK